MTPLVSVIMPAYNCEKTAGESIRSVLSQSVTDLELIIVDDCSSDSTLDVINGYAAEDHRIGVYSNPSNRGAAYTRNMAISHAKGKYIAFIDSDDLWEQKKLEIQLASLEKSGCDLCYTDYTFIDAAGNSLGKTYHVPEKVTYRELLKENIIGCTTVMLRSSVLPEAPFDPGYFHEDYVLWLHLLRGGINALGIPKPLVRYRTGGRSANKLKAAFHRWKIYRFSEKLSFLYSMYCLLCYFINGIKKDITVKNKLTIRA